jgi:hypothetical protein
MLLAYGHAEIEWQGDVYRLAPTFANIAKLGSPVEIVELFKSFSSPGAQWHKFNIAVCVLNACSDKPIPEKLTGFVKFSERQQRFMYHQPAHGLPMLDDVITLAEHCLIHGICGKTDKKTDGDPLKEFDAMVFIELARIHLDMSREESASLTMTEFVRLMEVKFPPAKEDGLSVEENDDMLAWFENQNKVH